MDQGEHRTRMYTIGGEEKLGMDNVINEDDIRAWSGSIESTAGDHIKRMEE